MFNKRVTIEVSFISMLILLCFNQTKILTLKQLGTETKIPLNLIQSKVNKLVEAGVLEEKGSNTFTVS